MEITELHPLLRELVTMEIDQEDYSDLSSWFLAVADYLHQNGTWGCPADWYYPHGLKGPQSMDPWRSMAIYDYTRAFSLTDEDITNFGQFLWDTRIALLKSVVTQSEEL
jgi:hypothetical protein